MKKIFLMIVLSLAFFAHAKKITQFLNIPMESGKDVFREALAEKGWTVTDADDGPELNAGRLLEFYEAPLERLVVTGKKYAGKTVKQMEITFFNGKVYDIFINFGHDEPGEPSVDDIYKALKKQYFIELLPSNYDEPDVLSNSSGDRVKRTLLTLKFDNRGREHRYEKACQDLIREVRNAKRDAKAEAAKKVDLSDI